MDKSSIECSPMTPFLIVSNEICYQLTLVTVVVALAFMASKCSYNVLRQWRTKLTILVLGCDPIGLTTVLIAAKSCKTSKIILLEEKSRKFLVAQPQQVALDARSVQFLKRLDVDFDNIEGCWQDERFCTPLGVLQEYLFSLIERQNVNMEVRLHTKLSKSIIDSLCLSKQRTLIVVCDSSSANWSTLLSINDEFVQESCKLYGAVAKLERMDQQQIPTPEITVNRLNLDLSAYDGEFCIPDSSRLTFHLKIFGTLRHRIIALVCPKSDSNLLRQLRMTANPWIMRNIFQESYNAYRLKTEPRLTDAATRNVKCSHRLFEVKLSYRRENVLFIEEDNIVITMEGHAARSLNLNSGLGVNLGIRALENMNNFITNVSHSDSSAAILETLIRKNKSAIKTSEDFIRGGIHTVMYC
ncbi:uncharacterized protein [Ptychodera flava]|uniref:uncharacterized protein n=1 Tax=Ptychodera flava TaxID=63121 RepID=UPI00396A7098